MDPRLKGRTLSLRVTDEEERFVMRAKDAKERDDWLAALAETQLAAKGIRRSADGSFAGTDSLKIVSGLSEEEARRLLETPRNSSLQSSGVSTLTDQDPCSPARRGLDARRGAAV